MEIKKIIEKKLIKTNETYEARLLESDENEYIAIKCTKGHLYRLSLTDSKFDYRLKNCPFCINSKRKMINNARYLPHNVNCMQSLADLFDNYIKCRIGDNESLFQYIDYTFVYQIDKDTIDMTDEGFNKNNVVNKKLIDLDIRHLDNLYSYEVNDFIEIILPLLKKKFEAETDTIDAIGRFLHSDNKELDIINIFNKHALLRENISYCIHRVVRDYISEIIQFRRVSIDDIETLENNDYYYDGKTIVTKELLQESNGIETPKLISKTLEIYKVKDNTIKADEHKKADERKKVKELKSQITLLENDIQEKLKQVYSLKEQVNSLKEQVNSLCNRQIYSNIEYINNNLYIWLLNCKDRELAEIILNNYSTKNGMRLTEIPIDSKETIWIKGRSGSNFKTSAFTITSQQKVLSKLPKGTSYPELFIYFYFKSIFPETVHRGKAPNTRYEYDIAIPEKRLVIEYNGSVYHKGEGSFDKIEIDTVKMNYAIDNGVDYIRIEDDGSNDIYFSDKLITFNGNVDNIDEKLYEICNIIKNKKLHSTKLKAITIEQIKRQIRLYY